MNALRNFAPAAVFSVFSFLIILPGSAKEEPLKESYGVVKRIVGNEMTVAVLDEKKKETKEETFKLAPETEVVIVRPATEVLEGDEVKINYSEGKDGKVSRFVSIIDIPAPAATAEPAKS